MNKKVLVLNANSLPINITSWERAMTLMYKGKASGVRYNGVVINGSYRLPEIIKLMSYVFVPYSDVVLSRKNIYLRDNHTCRYCGKANSTLTIDHVIPRSRGGQDTWENMVVCCSRCNCKKGNQTLAEAGMKLAGSPYRPSSTLYLQITRLANVPQSWEEFFFGKN